MLSRVRQVKSSSSFHLTDEIMCCVCGALLGHLSELYGLVGERTKTHDELNHYTGQ